MTTENLNPNRSSPHSVSLSLAATHLDRCCGFLSHKPSSSWFICFVFMLFFNLILLFLLIVHLISLFYAGFSCVISLVFNIKFNRYEFIYLFIYNFCRLSFNTCPSMSEIWLHPSGVQNLKLATMNRTKPRPSKSFVRHIFDIMSVFDAYTDNLLKIEFLFCFEYSLSLKMTNLVFMLLGMCHKKEYYLPRTKNKIPIEIKILKQKLHT